MFHRCITVPNEFILRGNRITVINYRTVNLSLTGNSSCQILKPADKKAKYQYGGLNSGRPVTPPRAGANNNKPGKKGK